MTSLQPQFLAEWKGSSQLQLFSLTSIRKWWTYVHLKATKSAPAASYDGSLFVNQIVFQTQKTVVLSAEVLTEGASGVDHLQG